MIRVHLGPRSYDIAIRGQVGDPATLSDFLRDRIGPTDRAFLVTDLNALNPAQTVQAALESLGIRTWMTTLEPGEERKSLESAALLYDQLADWLADRKTPLVAVGGGVIGDLTGFVAATYARGLPLWMIPTTLLAMVDSSVGGKVGINHRRAKNLIGAFHQPSGVWIDPDFLDSLPDREYRSGLAEVVKYGVILDADLFAILEAHIEPLLRRDADIVGQVVARCCQLKANVVEQDEREETGLRMILNYGHTFAHAFETVGGYGTWLHGEAVAAGMIGESRLAEKLGLIPAEVTERQLRLLHAFGLPTSWPSHWPAEDLIACMLRDKKSLAGKMRFILPTRIGQVQSVSEVTEFLIREVLHHE